jgi:hypothetical protein
MNTGRPFTPQLANVNLDLGEASRPDRIRKGTVPHPTADMWYAVSAFVPVPTGSYRFGNSGRNILDGPGYIGLNLALSKRFRLRERQSMQFRWEAFNFTNHTDFNLPEDSIDNTNAGMITAAKPARTMQFGLRYQF